MAELEWNFGTYSYWQCLDRTERGKTRKGCGWLQQVRDLKPAVPPCCPCGINGDRNPNVMTQLWKRTE
jgi:hypothetical protein